MVKVFLLSCLIVSAVADHGGGHFNGGHHDPFGQHDPQFQRARSPQRGQRTRARNVPNIPNAGLTGSFLEDELSQFDEVVTTTTGKPYAFQFKVDDRIEDQTQARYEVKTGDRVEGVYSYSDGHSQRTVHYVADKDGYRIVKEDVKPLPGLNRNEHTGEAYVAQEFDGGLSEYRVRAEEIARRKEEDELRRLGSLPRSPLPRVGARASAPVPPAPSPPVIRNASPVRQPAPRQQPPPESFDQFGSFFPRQ